MSSNPPTWVSPMKICGTEVRFARASISWRFSKSRSTRISVQVKPRCLRKFFAATQ
jgi:hypothetical protein